MPQRKWSEGEGRRLLRELSPRTRSCLRRQLGRSFAHLDVLDVPAIGQAGSDDLWQHPTQHGLIVFGAAPNGDAWAIDLRRGERVVLLSHDLIWEEEVDSPRKGLEPVATSLRQAFAWARSCALPIDYYDALELRSTLKRASRMAAPLVRLAVGRGFNVGLEAAIPLRDYVAGRSRPTPPHGFAGRAADLFDLLRRVRNRRTVQEVLVRIASLEGPWPTCDAVYIVAEAGLEQVSTWFGAGVHVAKGWSRPPSASSEMAPSKPDFGVPRPKKGYRVYTLHWL